MCYLGAEDKTTMPSYMKLPECDAFQKSYHCENNNNNNNDDNTAAEGPNPGDPNTEGGISRDIQQQDEGRQQAKAFLAHCGLDNLSMRPMSLRLPIILPINLTGNYRSWA